MICNFCGALYFLLCTFCFLLTVENVFCTLVFSVFGPHTRKHFPENFYDRKQTEHKKQEVPNTNRPSTQRTFVLSSVQSSEMASSALARISNLQRHIDPTESNHNKVFSFCIQIFKLHNFSLLGFNLNALNGLTNIQTVTH